MNIVLFAHPDFLNQQSMPRFLRMLSDGFTLRGHKVTILKPKPILFKLHFPKGQKKWLGYVDQFFLFPLQVKKFLRSCPPKTLFVFTDHALGPWIPLVAKRHNVVHCHDFLAQRSALGEFQSNTTGLSGRVYQKFIRNGYRHGQNFISVSKKTQTDLHRFLSHSPKLSEVVYNGFNQVCTALPAAEAQQQVQTFSAIDVSGGYFLHVGGNDWYKNRIGVIEMYTRWRSNYGKMLPLLLVGNQPSEEILAFKSSSPNNKDIYFLCGWPDEMVRTAYSGATALLFPSLAEGFGWPIAEAMACGCPVITTKEPPMCEVAGDAGFLIPGMPNSTREIVEWSHHAAAVMESIVMLSNDDRNKVIEAGLLNSKRFETNSALNKIEEIYESILAI